jgi:hypothetical protein
VRLTDFNRSVLVDMLTMLSDHVRTLEHESPMRRRHLRLLRLSRSLIKTLLENNPHEFVLDPDDFVRRSVLLYLDETCWALILKRRSDEAAFQEELARSRGRGAYYVQQ